MEKSKPGPSDYLIGSLKILLPITRGSFRAVAAVINQGAPLDALACKKIQGIALIAQLIELLLKTETRSVQHLIAVTILLNTLKTFSTFSSYHELENKIAMENHAAQLERVQQEHNQTQSFQRAYADVQHNAALQRHAEQLARAEQQLNEAEIAHTAHLADIRQQHIAAQAGLREEILNVQAQRNVSERLLAQARVDLNVARLNLGRVQANGNIIQELNNERQARFQAERQLQNTQVAYDVERRNRELAENRLREAGENRRHDIFGLGKQATQAEIKAAYEALMRDSAIGLDSDED